MSWAKSRTILRRLSSKATGRDGHLLSSQHSSDRITARRQWVFLSQGIHINPNGNSDAARSLGRRDESSSAHFSTVARDLLDDEEEHNDGFSNAQEPRHSSAWRRRGRRRREGHSRTPINSTANPTNSLSRTDIRTTATTTAAATSSSEYGGQSTIDRIVSSGGIGEYQSIDVDTVVTEDYLERLFDNHVSTSHKSHPPNPNLLLNMLELLHNEDTHISNETVLKLFREVVGTKRVKLLERAEAVVVKNRYDPRLLRLLVTGYLNAGVPQKACDLLMEWPNESIQHQPGIESYRRVLTALGTENRPKRRNQRRKRQPYKRDHTDSPPNGGNKRSDNHNNNTEQSNHLLVHRLLQHMYQMHAKFPGLNLAPDRDCFHRALAACSSIESLPTAKAILEEMKTFATVPNHEEVLDTLPNVSTARVLVDTWTCRNLEMRGRTMVDLQKEAFEFLRRMEEEALASAWPETDNASPTVDVDCYNVLLNAVAENGRYQLAESFFLRLLTDYLKGETSNIPPDEVTLNTVLKAHVKANKEQAALSAEKFIERLDHFFEQQKQLRKAKRDCPDAPRIVYDIQPTARTRSALSNLWIHLGRPDKAIESLSRAEEVYHRKEEELRVHREHHPESPHVHNIVNIQHFRPDKITYRQIIGGLSKLHDPPTEKLATQCEEIAERMCKMGHRLNLLTSNTILNCWTKSGHPHRAEAYLEDVMLGKHRAVPDIVSYNTIIHGYARLGNLERALELLTTLLEDNLQQDYQQPRKFPKVNVRTFTNILIALSKEQTEEAAEEAERLLLQMQELNDPPYNLNTRPNTVTYNAVMNCWASLSLPSSKRERRQTERKHSPKTHHNKSNAVDKGTTSTKRLNNEHHRLGRKAEFVLQSMQNLGPDEKPNVISYNIVIRAYSNDVEKAEELIQGMIANGLKPTDHTYNTVVHVLNRDYRITDKNEKLQELIQKYFPSRIGSSRS